jgi:Putative beta-barrel porin-2, OmpL-like. bbp2
MLLLRLLIILLSLLPLTANAAIFFVNHPNLHINFPADYDAYVYGSYNYLSQSKYFVSDVPDRLSDSAENGGRLQQAYLSVGHLQEGWGGFADVLVGLDAYYLAPLGWNPNFFNINNVGVAMPEGYLQYRFHNNCLIKTGMLMTVAGYEPYTYTAATSFSHSILNGYAEPGTHAGMRFGQFVNDAWSYFAGAGSGWNTIRNAGSIKMLEGGVVYGADQPTSFTFNFYLGKDHMTDYDVSGPTGVRQLIDVYGNYQIIEPLTLAFNIDYGTQSRALLPTLETGHAAWGGIAGYVIYDLTERVKSAFRAEIFNDVNGTRTGLRQVWKELTLSLLYHPVKPLTLLAEVRHDFSNVNSFVQSNGIGVINYQQSFALTAMINFAQ